MPDTGSETGNSIQGDVQREYAEAARRAYGRAKDNTNTAGPVKDNTPPVNGTK